MRIRVELDGDADFPRPVDDGTQIDRVWLAREQEPAGGMAQYREPRIVESAEHTRRHRGAVHREAGVHGADDEVEAVEQRGVVIERSVGEDVALDTLEDPYVRACRIERVDLVMLRQHALARQPAGVERALRMV